MAAEDESTNYGVPIPVRLPDELRAKIEQAAKERLTSQSAIIREAVKSYFDREKEGIDVTQEECCKLIDERVGAIVEEKIREVFAKLTTEE